MKNCIFLFFPLVLAVSFSGCATTPDGILISAQRDPAFSPAPTNTICLSLLHNPSKEDAALGAALTAELAVEHFNIVTNNDADYTLAYLIEDDSTSENVPRAIHVSPVTQTRVPVYPLGITSPYLCAQEPDVEGPGEPSMPTTIVEVEYIHPDQGIRLYLYTNPKTHPGGLQIAWQGCIEAGKTVSSKREPVLIKTLLGYFGQDYTGRIELTNSAPSPSLTH